MKSSERIFILIAMTLLIAVSAAVVFGGLYFGLAGFFYLIGVTYESNGTLLLFVFYCILIGIIFEIIEKVILFFLMKSNLQARKKFIWMALVKLALTWMVIHTVNEWMTGITLTGFAEILTAILIFSVDIVFDDEQKKDHRRPL
ncbi:YrvL family regulatory protein [Sporosarcina cascadiensis]|uniref:YrvL family regulatory protein n=1 Tax=Sporosarcina cascadiensis TaxID=2660747 RepID=UPI001890D4EE|nr:YrvL family regulatory protein [Sporosarcina cascadiensis]